MKFGPLLDIIWSNAVSNVLTAALSAGIIWVTELSNSVNMATKA